MVISFDPLLYFYRHFIHIDTEGKRSEGYSRKKSPEIPSNRIISELFSVSFRFLYISSFTLQRKVSITLSVKPAEDAFHLQKALIIAKYDLTSQRGPVMALEKLGDEANGSLIEIPRGSYLLTSFPRKGDLEGSKRLYRDDAERFCV